MKVSSVAAVRFASVLDDEYEGLQYVKGLWQRVIDFRIYHVSKNIRFFRRSTWAVYVFAGADTAALGGGTVWYDQVSEEFGSELEAIRYMAVMKPEWEEWANEG